MKIKNQTIEKQNETIQSQDRTIKELEVLVKDLQNQLNDFQADEHTGQKKKRKREVTDTNTSEEDMNKKVDKLQVRLAEREAELEDTREILAQSEYTTKTTKNKPPIAAQCQQTSAVCFENIAITTIPPSTA